MPYQPVDEGAKFVRTRTASFHTHAVMLTERDAAGENPPASVRGT